MVRATHPRELCPRNFFILLFFSVPRDPRKRMIETSVSNGRSVRLERLVAGPSGDFSGIIDPKALSLRRSRGELRWPPRRLARFDVKPAAPSPRMAPRGRTTTGPFGTGERDTRSFEVICVGEALARWGSDVLRVGGHCLARGRVPRMGSSYRHPALKQLKEQQARFAPRERRLEQIDRAEQLLAEIEPGQVLPLRVPLLSGSRDSAPRGRPPWCSTAATSGTTCGCSSRTCRRRSARRPSRRPSRS